MKTPIDPSWFAIVIWWSCGCAFAITETNELQRSTWNDPTHEEVLSELETWLAETAAPQAAQDAIRAAWRTPVPVANRLDLLADAFSLVDPDAKALVDHCRQLKSGPPLPDFELLRREESPAFARNHLRLIFGRWLAHQQLYDESLDQIRALDPGDVVDPATLLFYQSVAYYRLLRKDECLPVVQRLLEREESLPKRFSRMAKLIQADIEPLKADSLDEVSRLMDSIQVRLGHGRTGTRVRKEEDDVIAKLDKMIKQLEDQAQQAAAAAQAGSTPGENLQPAAPMQDSVPGGGSGPGNASPKDLGSQDGWGDLPPKERQQALQQLGKEFPSHYRDVIEEFFRKLAREGADK